MFSLSRLILILLLLMVAGCMSNLSAQDRRVERAEKAFELRQYHEAIDLYRRAYDRVRRNDREEATRLMFKVALCYRYTNQHRMAEAWFNRAVRAGYDDPEALLFLADAMMMNEKYGEALERYREFTDLVPDDWRGPRGIASVELALELQDKPSQYEVDEIRILNSRQDDYTAAFGDHRGSTLIFASSRDNALGDHEDPWTGNQPTSFFVSQQDRAGDWNRPVLLDEGPVNTEFNEGAPSVNLDATEMFFTRCTRSDGADVGCRIYRASREGAGWGSPREVNLTNDSLVTVGHPAISPDGLELYFAADLPGSIGDRDIWVASRNSQRDDFGPPRNLGEPVNTRGNEMFPYVRDDGTLYFASDGHPGMGGLDIFKTTHTPEGWTEPENVGKPVNSPADDFGIIFKPGEDEGFFSSNRGRTGAYDIYYFIDPPLELYITGVVLDDSTQTSVPDAQVQLIGSDGSLRRIQSDREGRYIFGPSMVREDTRYDIVVNKTGYFAGRGEQSTLDVQENREFIVDIGIAPIPETAIELPEILYEFDSWELQEQFKDSLNGLVRTMNDNPNFVIELASHTDSRGTHAYNDTLSYRRAQAVVDYLVEQGIDPERLEAAGYGMREPRVLERDVEREGFLFEAGTELTADFIEGLPSEEIQDAAHQMNRRTEFRVLREDYEPPEEEVPDQEDPDGNRENDGRPEGG